VDPAGFAAWLAWLQSAQNQPGVILSADQDKLQERFAAGDAAYLVAGPGALNSLQVALGTANVGVTLLPAGPAGEGSPFLRIEGFLFGADASDRQTELALIFAKFATSSASQALLSKEADLVPTNKLAIEKTSDPVIAGFLKQALRTGVILPPTAGRDTLAAGDEVYREVLAGNLTPAEAANELYNR
jgi:ABC-type glycerol-3-phosphate transport system substrate-binding protein